MPTRVITTAVLAMAILLPATGPARAQDPAAYPVRPIRLIVPFPAGGNGDSLVRPIGTKLAERWGHQVVIDNRGGANTIIGTDLAAKAPPDGYTLLLATQTSHAINPNVYAKLPFDAARDFAPVAPITRYSYTVATHPSVPATTPAELVALAKAKPGTLSYASTGNGSTGHLAGALFETIAGVKLLHVPYKGSGPASIDLLAGQVMMSFTGMAIIVPHLKARRLKVIGICSERRLPAWPDIPAFGEIGLKGFEAGTWFGIVSRAGTPPAIVRKLNEAITAAIRTPDVTDRYGTLGFDIYTADPDAFGRFIAEDRARTARVVKASNIRLD